MNQRPHPHVRFAGFAFSNSGFTLAELMVSMTVTAMILAILLQLFNQVVSAWNQENKREYSRRESRSGLRLLVDDLQNLYAIPESAPSFTSTHNPNIQRFILVPPTNGDATKQSSSFAFIRTIPVKSRSSAPENLDLALVLYSAAFSQDADGNTSLKFWRRQLSATDTLDRLQKHLTEGLPLVSDADWHSMSSPSISQDDPVVYDLIRCVVTPMNHDDSPLINSHVALMPLSSTLNASSAPWPEEQIPTHLEIALSVTNRANAGQLQSTQDWTAEINNQTATGDQNPEILTQTLRIRLPAHQPITVPPP